jgi:hypothetical protein
MADFFYLLLSGGFFAATVALSYLFDRLLRQP